jgi:ABC-type lipoprotein release transport system permease subunit
MYRLFLALRYLRTRKISLLSVFGVMVGVAVMLVVTSIMSGFARDMRARIRGMTAHITVQPSRGAKAMMMEDWPSIAAELKKDPEVVGVSPQLEWAMMIDKGPRAATIVGIEPEMETQVSGFSGYILDGHPPDFSNLTGKALAEGQIPVILGSGILSRHLNKDVVFVCDGPGSLEAAAACLPAVNPKDSFGVVTAAGDFDDDLASSERERATGAAAKWMRSRQAPEAPAFEDLFERALRMMAYDTKKEQRRATLVVLTNREVRAGALEAAWKRLEPGQRALLPVLTEEGLLKEPGTSAERVWAADVLVIEPGPNGARRFVERLGTQYVGMLLAITTITPYDVKNRPLDGRIAPTSGRLAIVGVFNSGMNEYDTMIVYAPLNEVQALLRECDCEPGGGPPIRDGQGRVRNGRINKLRVKIRNYDDAEAIAARLSRALRGRYEVSTWQDEKAILLQAVAVERGITGVIMFFIVIVAAFSILAMLLTLVTEKTRDIGITRAMGGTVGGVMSVFVAEGAIIGVVGCALGLGAALLVIDNLNPIADWIHARTGWYPFPKDVYLLDKIPAHVETPHWALIVGASLFLCVLAGVWPAWKAARLNPVEALRYE